MNKGAEERSIHFVEVQELIERQKNENTSREIMADVKLSQHWLTLVTTKLEVKLVIKLEVKLEI